MPWAITKIYAPLKEFKISVHSKRVSRISWILKVSEGMAESAASKTICTKMQLCANLDRFKVTLLSYEKK